MIVWPSDEKKEGRLGSKWAPIKSQQLFIKNIVMYKQQIADDQSIVWVTTLIEIWLLFLILTQITIKSQVVLERFLPCVSLKEEEKNKLNKPDALLSMMAG